VLRTQLTRFILTVLHLNRNSKEIVQTRTIKQLSMVHSHSSQSTYKLEVGQMLFVAQAGVWVNLERVIITANKYKVSRSLITRAFGLE